MFLQGTKLPNKRTCTRHEMRNGPRHASRCRTADWMRGSSVSSVLWCGGRLSLPLAAGK